MWHRSSWERAAGQAVTPLLGQDSQRELTGGSLALCLCSAISVAGSAAEAALLPYPVFLFYQGGRGEQAVDSPLLHAAGKLIYVNYFF